MPDDPMVSCAWLAEHLNTPGIRVVDATWFMPGDARDAKALYAAQRIPGAVFFGIDEIASTETSLPHMLPSPEKFASCMRKLGIGDGMRIVVYDRHGVFSAARVWWTFRVMGHEDVVVLDGGFPAWEAAGLPIEEDTLAPRAERHFTTQYRADLVRDLSDMRRILDQGTTPVLDARPGPRFRGEAPEPRAGLRSGHMPGAKNVPSSSLVTEDGLLRSKEDLAALFKNTEVDLSRAPVCTCGSGITAAIVALALARFGRWDASVYDGSWAEWGARDDTPVAQGAA